jgi:hypothetical protein
VRVRVAAQGGFGQALTLIHAWLDENCGADGWTTAPSGTRGVGNDATSFYFRDAMLAAAFIARWCDGGVPPPTGGAFQLRQGRPETKRRACGASNKGRGVRGSRRGPDWRRAENLREGASPDGQAAGGSGRPAGAQRGGRLATGSVSRGE